jgi:hypothetical protein
MANLYPFWRESDGATATATATAIATPTATPTAAPIAAPIRAHTQNVVYCDDSIDDRNSDVIGDKLAIDKLYECITTTNQYWLGDDASFKTKFQAMALGNIMEWYDYIMFGSLADVISEEFFPAENSRIAFIESWALFGVAFIMRPLGGSLIGFIGDRFGRKKALEISVGMMLLSSFCIGCLPSYHDFGWSMTALLVLFRLMQGLSCGGETVGAFIYILESTRGRNRGFWGARVFLNSNIC